MKKKRKARGGPDSAGTRAVSARCDVRVVLVQPLYEINIGAVARAMKNFGFSDLAIVSPRCNHKGFDAIKYSKHARGVLESAKVHKSFSSAVAGCKFKIGTSGVLFRHFKQTFRSPIMMSELREKLRMRKDGKIALIFGNEGVGLSEKHISACDFLVTIPTSEEYPVLNLSHAVAICLYELSQIDVKSFEPAPERQKEELVRAFSLLAGRYSKDMRNPRKTKIAFRRIIGKSMASDKECSSILGVLRRAVKELEGKGEG